MQNYEHLRWVVSIYNHECTLCSLSSTCKTICMEASVGTLPAMVIGEAPGGNEDELGAPFVGRAGQELIKALKAAGLARERVTITNVVKCRPPGNRTPTITEITSCWTYLVKEVRAYKPKHILTLGLPASIALTGISDSMGNLRGQWVKVADAKIMPTYHPAYVLRHNVYSEIWQRFRDDVTEFAEEVLHD